ncbi:MAG: Thymidylate synthase [Parcubacteria group bacterium Gr01-1014_48]|nr:MAG: Thymidylate synthase [Parcubacteria group bacterium Greene0416_14]TSC73531.1 MAG: Thymidylate synthase [Parcubacteria group bacterium Gr01-1014_48]TSD00096.1 MAG: Thymidylate synthase [Parcubacteria group bacterium Greene1014_15]TSD07673.1 MAG: Succinate-semialdehyde dehydrogenase [Parcubacteria group bacterium Greene0714_4]
MTNERHPEYQYLDLLRDIMEHGASKKDHNTGMPLSSVFGRQIRFDLSKGFPLLTTKKVYWKGVLHELYWFLSGQSNIKYLVDNDVHIWDDYPYKIYAKKAEMETVPTLTQAKFIERIKNDGEFAKMYGELPYIYGQQWRRWPAKNGRTIDQLEWIVDTIKNFPDRKHTVLSVWNPEYLYSMALPGEALSFPLCHILIHFNVAGNRLSCQLYQRSADMFLGVPFNIASYALLTHIIAKITGYEPGDFVHTFGDAHIYSNHFEAVRVQLSREPKEFPKISIDDAAVSLDSFRPEHVRLEHYDPHKGIKGELTVAGGFNEDDRKKYVQAV